MTTRDPVIFIALLLSVGAFILARKAFSRSRSESSTASGGMLNELVQELTIRVGDLSARVNNSNTELEKQVNYLSRQMKKLEKNGNLDAVDLQFDTTDVLEDRIKKLEEELGKRQGGKIDFELKLEEINPLELAIEANARPTEDRLSQAFTATRTALLSSLVQLNNEKNDRAVVGDELQSQLKGLFGETRAAALRTDTSEEMASASATQRKLRALIEKDFTEQLPGEISAARVDGAMKIVLIIGLPSSGKTSVASRLSSQLRAAGTKVALAATAPYPASIARKVAEWARDKEITLIAPGADSKPTTAAYKAVHLAQDANADLLLIDVAPSDADIPRYANLVADIAKAISREQMFAPHEVLLTCASGSEAEAAKLVQALSTRSAVSALCITKTEEREWLAPALEFASEQKVPVRYASLGAGERDLISLSLVRVLDALVPNPEESSSQPETTSFESLPPVLN